MNAELVWHCCTYFLGATEQGGDSGWRQGFHSDRHRKHTHTSARTHHARTHPAYRRTGLQPATVCARKSSQFRKSWSAADPARCRRRRWSGDCSWCQLNGRDFSNSISSACIMFVTIVKVTIGSQYKCALEVARYLDFLFEVCPAVWLVAAVSSFYQ